MASPSYLPNTESQRRVSLQQIDSVVVARLGSTRGLGKSQPACFNRQVAIYLASQVGRWSTTVIGRFYGGRDRSTVVHSYRIASSADVEARASHALDRGTDSRTAGRQKTRVPESYTQPYCLVRRYPMIRNAKDLSPDQKAAIESLLGRRILEDEAVSIRAFAPLRFPTSAGTRSQTS